MPRNIDALIWRAFTDGAFRKSLMNGHRQELVDAMGLTGEEREMALAVQADSLEDFAGALCQCFAEPQGLRGCSVV